MRRREAIQAMFAPLLAQPPYLDRRLERVDFGEAAEETNSSPDVPIGFFGPDGDCRRAVGEVLNEANRNGSVNDKPFRLVAKWTDDPWRSGSRLVVEMAYTDRVAALICAADSAAVHVAEQVAVKARLPLLDSTSTDVSSNAAMVPWIFSCLPGDAQIAACLGTGLLAECGRGPFTLISGQGHDERLLTWELLRFFAKHQRVPDRHLPMSGAGEAPTQFVVIVGNTSETAIALNALQGSRVFAGPAVARKECLLRAGGLIEGVRYPVLCRLAHGEDYAQTQTRDAARLLVDAIRRAGMSRAAIREALVSLSPWSGTAGEIRWNPLNRNLRAPALGVLSRSNEWELSVIKES